MVKTSDTSLKTTVAQPSATKTSTERTSPTGQDGSIHDGIDRRVRSITTQQANAGGAFRMH
jgi:hypothetical protein